MNRAFLTKTLYHNVEIFKRKGCDKLVPFEKIEQLLKKKNITMYRVTKDLKFSTSTMSNWKAGRNSPTVENLAKLAKYFKVPMEYFLEEKVNDR